MRIWLHRLEKFVDKIIAPLLVALLLIIAGEIFLGERFRSYGAYADAFDFFIITVFATDLTFKFYRTKNIPKFVKSYWLEILATIPFFLAFRFMEFFGLEKLIDRGQEFAHEAPELQKLEKGTANIVREAGRAGRTAKLIQTFRITSRFPRFLKVMPFYEKPTGKHHPHEKRKG
ncbi:hypothetical protein HYX10_01050 [Candidatus Woesearchaeota archaeon]|nr:hypothetical protein [Candidatus Woesearchaeota archaeon]